MWGMELRTLGRTGLKVSEQCLGAMMFGAWGNRDQDECVAIVHRALDAGINFVDTADMYAHGESEEIVGKALKGRRDEVVLATKSSTRWATAQPAGRLPAWINQAVEDSLRRLTPTTSTCTRCTGPTPTPISTRPSAR